MLRRELRLIFFVQLIPRFWNLSLGSIEVFPRDLPDSSLSSEAAQFGLSPEWD
jgi:hypothetical protein